MTCDRCSRGKGSFRRPRVGGLRDTKDLWQALRRDALGVRFRRQVILGPFIVDFFAPSHRLVVEVDGPIHLNHTDVDRLRDEALVARGLRVVRITADVVESDLEAALVIVRRALASA